MRPTLLSTPALLLTLLAGCGGSTSGEPGAAEASAAPKKPEPKLVAARDGRPAMLDTGIDLSHLRDTSARPEFPTPQGPARLTGPPGGLQIVEGDETTSFGELLEGDTVDKTFRFKSSGESPLIIDRVKPSCGCTAAELQLVAADGTLSKYQLGTPLAPGTEIQMGVSVNTTNRQGPFHSNVAVYSNDAASPLKLQLEANVKAVLSVAPLNLDLGQLTSGEMREGTVKITSDVLEPFKLELDTTDIVAPLAADLRAVDPDAEGRSRAWELKISLGPDIPEGMRRYQIRMTSDIPQRGDSHDGHGHGPSEPTTGTRAVNCFINANVTALVVAVPNFISFGAVRLGEPMERTVKVECLDPEFNLPAAPAHSFQSITGGEFTGAENFSVRVSPTPDSNGKALDVTLRLEGLPDDYTGSFGGMLTLAVGHPTKADVSIRFSGVARPGIPATPRDAGIPATSRDN